MDQQVKLKQYDKELFAKTIVKLEPNQNSLEEEKDKFISNMCDFIDRLNFETNQFLGRPKANFKDIIKGLLLMSYHGFSYRRTISDLKKMHDKNDSSTEFDFFFDLNGKTYGIGAKRTLRERYKQFIKTAHMSKIDIMIEVTLGVDLNETKAKSITNHGVYLFVSDEIYRSRKFLHKIKGVYSVKSLNLSFLQNLN